MKSKIFQLIIFLLIFGVTLLNILITPYLQHKLQEEEKLYGAISRQRLMLNLKKKQDSNPVLSLEINEVKMAKEVKIKIDYFYL